MKRELGAAFRRRLGLLPANEERELALVDALYNFLLETQAPFEQTLFDWRGGLLSADRAARSPSAEHYTAPIFSPVRAALDGFEPAPDARLDHPYFASERPCTMLIDEVEAIWAQIAEADDWSALVAKLDAIALMPEACGAR